MGPIYSKLLDSWSECKTLIQSKFKRNNHEQFLFFADFLVVPLRPDDLVTGEQFGQILNFISISQMEFNSFWHS